jgi:tRNA pseudouridine65 synthase
MCYLKRMEPTILTQGPGWLVIDKPAGLSVHNDPEGKADALSVLHAILTRNPELAKATAWDRAFGLAPVHRLDRDTSGVLLIATQKNTASRLQQEFEARRVEKTYRAIVRGSLQGGGSWNFPLSERAEGRRNPQGPLAERKPCSTVFRLVRANAHLSELEIDLLTGRQHQIRRHAALARHEVAFDRRYGDPRYVKRLEGIFGFSRLLLHSSRLKLTSGETRIDVESPTPEEFERVFAP